MTDQPYQGKVVAITGFDPINLDLSAFPGLTPEKIVDGLEAQAEVLRAKGAEVKVLLYDAMDFSSVERIVLPELARCDVFEIGAGVRTIPMYLEYFEKLLNFVHEHAPKKTKVCFNTNPGDTIGAIERWL